MLGSLFSESCVLVASITSLDENVSWLLGSQVIPASVTALERKVYWLIRKPDYTYDCLGTVCWISTAMKRKVPWLVWKSGNTYLQLWREGIQDTYNFDEKGILTCWEFRQCLKLGSGGGSLLASCGSCMSSLYRILWISPGKSILLLKWLVPFSLKANSVMNYFSAYQPLRVIGTARADMSYFWKSLKFLKHFKCHIL